MPIRGPRPLSLAGNNMNWITCSIAHAGAVKIIQVPARSLLGILIKLKAETNETFEILNSPLTLCM